MMTRAANAVRNVRTTGRAETRRRFDRAAFTLVELLVTISILAILGAALVFASFQATEAARRSATRAKVNAINSLLMERWESYLGRRIGIPRLVEQAIRNAYRRNPQGDRLINEELTSQRLRAIRELMKLELPDRWSDVTLSVIQPTPSATVERAPKYMPNNRRTALAEAYLRQFKRIADDSFRNSLTGQPNRAEDIIKNQSAECLYMIIMLATGDGEARSFFRESDIGDTDGDGAPEILDGWGRPIHFIRWPAGFVSETQSYLYFDANGNPAIQPAEAIAEDHDPFDIYRRDPTGIRLVPLVFSAGEDGDPDLDLDPVPLDPLSLNPYARTASGLFLGAPNADDDGDNWTDNIHNHLKDVK